MTLGSNRPAELPACLCTVSVSLRSWEAQELWQHLFLTGAWQPWLGQLPAEASAVDVALHAL